MMSSLEISLEHMENRILSNGIHAIDYIQKTFQSCDWFFHSLNSLAAPPTSFFLIFPIAYFMCPKIGVLIVWTMCISEWINGLLKWMLHGQRPYWWVVEHNLQLFDMDLRQFPSTCETGPGSPSGHCMVTAATWYLLVAYLSNGLSRLNSCNLKFLFLIVLTLIGVARCYIASHFPHQVIAGIIAGVLLGILIGKSSLVKARPWKYGLAGVGVFLSASAAHRVIVKLGFDPNWSIILASHSCKNKAWIHKETNVFFAFARDSATLIGTGLALWILSSLLHKSHELKPCPKRRVIGCIISCFLSWFLRHYNLSLSSNFYLLESLNYALIPLVVMVVVPLILGLVGPVSVKTDNGKKSR